MFCSPKRLGQLLTEILHSGILIHSSIRCRFFYLEQNRRCSSCVKGQPCERGRVSRVWFSVLEKEKWKSGNDQRIGKKGISKNARGWGRGRGSDALEAEARQAVWGYPLGPPQPRIPTKLINLEGAHHPVHFILIC